ncbi:Pre-mRNA-splicing factor CWC26 [Pseudozyma hubeiensis]|nr:Pre-mRNA-splicing factor CWC26 [Pseudozyma hubeiensis]
MPDPNLQSYIAAHYLSGPKADAILARNSSDIKVKRKKKRPKADESAGASSSSGLVFKDESDMWKKQTEDEEDNAGLTPQVVGEWAAGSSSKAFRRIGPSKNRTEEKEVSGDVAEGSASVSAADEPTEFKAGLRTKEEMKAARLARESRKKRAAEASSVEPSTLSAPQPDEDEEARLAQQTVYRDSSGRVIDIHAQQAEQERLERLRLEKEAERSTWSHGLVQKQQRQKAAAQLSAVEKQGIARRATDDEYNAHFKEQQRADDPALAFLTKKRTSGPVKPKYKGAWPSNRFNIPPGYRWDGVDRGNGYEKAFFERKAQLETREQQARAWGQSDM